MKAFLIKEQSVWAKVACIVLSQAPMALVFNNTVHIWGTTKEKFLANTKWVKHEQCHIQQYKRYGTAQFLLLYMWEYFQHGYYNNRFEKEARLAEKCADIDHDF